MSGNFPNLAEIMTLPDDVVIYYQNEHHAPETLGRINIYICFEQSFSHPSLDYLLRCDLVIVTDPSLLKTIPTKSINWVWCPSMLNLAVFDTISCKKTEKGLCYNGVFFALDSYHDRIFLLNELRDQGFQFNLNTTNEPYNYTQYLQSICAQEMQLVVFSKNQTISGRLYENAAAYSLNVIYTPTPYIRQCLRNAGWQHMQNCFCFANYNELMQVFDLTESQIQFLTGYAFIEVQNHNITEFMYQINQFLDPSQIIPQPLMLPSEITLLKTLATATDHVAGAWAEVGVYEGGSAKILADLKSVYTQLYLFDTFEGLPDVFRSNEQQFIPGQFVSNEARVRALFVADPNVIITKGYFPLAGIWDAYQFAFVNLDVDSYQCTKECLEYFYPKINLGGIIVTHDFGKNAPGVREAWQEFFQERLETTIEIGEQAFIIKIGAVE